MRRTANVGRVLDDGSSQVWSYAYNTRGLLTQVVDPVGRETDYVYDATGVDMLQVKQKRVGTFDVLETSTYNSQHQPLTVTDAAGRTTTYTYNAAGQVLTVTNAKGETTTYGYSGGYVTSISGPIGGATVTLGYDGYGRVNAVTDSEGYVVTAQYDAAGRVTRTTYPDGSYEQTVYDKLDPQQQRDRLGRWTSFTYNSARQLVSVRDPLGRITTLDRCGCGSLDALVDGNGNRTRWDRDVEGRVTAETRADGAATQYAYETTTPRLKQVTDRKGQVATYSYFKDDAFKQKVYTNAAVATATVSATYDPAYHRLATLVDGTGTTAVTYHPVGTGQLGAGQVATADGPLSGDTIAYTYDELGRVASRSIDSVAQSLTYDALGRVTGVTNALGAFGYTYVGSSGRLAAMSYPNGQTSTYSYFGHTSDDRLQTILHRRADTTTISRFDYTFDGVGNIASWTRQVDAAVPTAYQFGYDARDQITAATKQTTAATPSVLTRYRYAYDPAGNRTSEQIDDALTSAAYNTANELMSTQPSGGLYFAGTVNEPASVTISAKPAAVAPDGTFAGTAPVASGTNTVTIAATDVSGNTATKQYQVSVSGSGATRTYDANGNLTSDGTRTFTWDAENRLISVTIGTHVSAFTYDGLSRRVKMVEADNGSTTSDTRLLWCGLEICEARDSSGTTVTKRYFPQGVQDGGTAYFYTRDHIGSVRELTDSTGTVRARYDYDPWGRRMKVAGDRDSEAGFTGHYQHGPTGLTLAPYRAYDSSVGRWMSEDPAGLADGTNRFEYSANNSVLVSDPTGLCGESVIDWAYWKGFRSGAAAEFKQGGCARLFFDKTLDALSPFSLSLSSGAEPLANYLTATTYNKTLAYAASRVNALGGRGLINPMRSSVVRSLLREVSARSISAPLLQLDLAIGQGLISEFMAFRRGECS